MSNGLNYARDTLLHGNTVLFGLADIDGNGNFFGVLLEIIIFFFAVCGVGQICDERLVPALEALVAKWEMKEDVAGSTLMAVGSSAPEIVISCITALEGGESLELGVSSILGSGLMAFLGVPCACALFAGQVLEVKRRALMRDFFVYIASLFLLFIYFWDGTVTVVECILLILVYILYVCWVIYFPKLKKMKCKNWCEGGGYKLDHTKKEGEEEDSDADDAEMVDDELDEGLYVPRSGLRKKIKLSKLGKFFAKCMKKSTAKKLADNIEYYFGFISICFTWPTNKVAVYLCPPPTKKDGSFSYIALATLILSFVWIAVYSFLITSCVDRWTEIIETAYPTITGLKALFGLSIVAWGGAVPDTISSVMVARKGLGSMAINSSVGSQIINIGVGLGFPWLLMCLAKGGSIPFGDGTNTTLRDNCIKTAAFVIVACIVFFCCTIVATWIWHQSKVILNPLKGYIFLVTYVGCLVVYGLNALGVISL
ncbi:hypothetical protein WA158_004504 [Blastocystis sp. Blastoise]